MKRKQKNKINIKSNSGFTMADLIAALTIFTIFTGIICGLFYSAYKVSLETKLSSTALRILSSFVSFKFVRFARDVC